MTTTKSVHHLKTTGKCPYGKQVEDASGLNHHQQPVNLLWRQDVEGGMLFYLLKEKQSLNYSNELNEDRGLAPIGMLEYWNIKKNSGAFKFTVPSTSCRSSET